MHDSMQSVKPDARQVKCRCGAVLGTRTPRGVEVGRAYIPGRVRLRCRGCGAETSAVPLPVGETTTVQ